MDGIQIRVHASFLLLILFVFLSGAARTPRGLLAEAGWIAVVFACVLVHELAHSVTAKHYGINVKDILLLPIGGVSEIEDMPREPQRELAIAAAGPLASLAIGMLALGICLLLGERAWPPTLFAGALLARLGWLNLLLGAFNLLPALPLDGGRVLRAGLAMRMGRSRATELAARLGKGAGIALMVVGLFYNIWWLLIGAFVYFGASVEGRDEQVHRILSARTAGLFMFTAPWAVDAKAYVSRESLAEACRHQGGLAVTQAGVYLGMLGPAQAHLIHPQVTAGEVADRTAPAFHPDDHLDEVLDAMRRTGQPAIAVVGPDDHVTGIVREAELEAALAVRPRINA